MGFLNTDSMPRLVEKLADGDNIKITGNSKGNRVGTVVKKIVEKADDVTKAIEQEVVNDGYSFKVGTGDVDVSGDVEEGKIEVGLSGRTYQNLVEYIADYEGYGKNGSYYSKNANRKLSFGLKPNTVYTRILDVKECFEPFRMYDSINNSDGTYRQYSYWIKQGLVINKFTSSDLGTIDSYTFNPDQNVTIKENFNIVIGRMILLEGDHTQTPIEELPKYFEGIKSSFENGVVEVEVQGKNLVDLSKFNRASNAVSQVNIVNNTISFSSSTRYNGVGQTFSEEEYKKMVGKYVTVSCGKITTSTGDSNDAYVFLKQSFVNSDGSTTWNNSTIASGQSKKIKILEGVDLTRFGIFVEPSNPVSGSIDIKAENIQLEIDNTSTSYEPYYKKKISFNIGEPLRSLPNGVCDEIVEDCLIRRVGKLVLDGVKSFSETSSDSTFEKTIRFMFYPQILRREGVTNLSCDKFSVENVYAVDREGVLGSAGGNTMYLRISKSKLETLDVNGLKKWLKTNPITIYYELATPTITPIEAIEFEVKPLATMIINSDIAPVSNHKVVLNRAGQIEQGIVQIAELKSRVDALETAYDSYLLETQHKLSLLGFEYELESEEI